MILSAITLGVPSLSFSSKGESKANIDRFTDSLKYRIGLSYTSNFKDRSLSEHFSSMVYTPVISSNFFENLPINISLNFSQNKNSDEEVTFGNTVISTSGGLGNGFMRSHSIILPTSENSRDVKNNLGNITNTLIYNYSKEINERFSISGSLGVTYNYGLFRYETDLYGVSNIQNFFTETASLGVSFNNLTLSSYFGLTQAYTFSSNLTEGYYLGHNINYVFSKKLSFGLTYSSGGSLLAPNGEDLGIQLFDKDNDTFTINTNYNF